MSHRPTRVAARIAGVYALVAAAWILVSDRILATVLDGAGALAVGGTMKGIGFVLVTSILLFTYVRREITKVELVNVGLRHHERELDRRARRLADLHAIDVEILAATEPRELVAGALARLRELVPCQRASVLLFDDPEDCARMFVVDQEEQFGPGTGVTVPLDEVITAELLAAGKVVAIDDLETFDRWPLLDRLLDRGIRSLLFAPMVSDQPAMGALVLSFTQPSGYDDEHTAIAKEVAYQLTIALTQGAMRAQLDARLEDLRRSDTTRRKLHADLVTAQEDERRRIAEDLHDDPVQALTTIGLRLAAIGVRTTDPMTRAALENLEDLVSRATRRLRGLMFDLRPPTLEQDGLVVTIKRTLDRTFSPEMDVRCETTLSEEPTLDVSLTAYRIVLEAITNVRKHARATTVEIDVHEEQGGLLVRITDDGVGLAPDVASEPGHIGLDSMHERAARAGGWCHLEPCLRGTEVRFWLPQEPLVAAAG